jgi:hypothetical protein
MERALGEKGREPVEVWGAARAAEGEAWAAIGPEQALGATVFARTVAQPSHIKRVSPVIRYSVPSVVPR